MDRRGSDRRSSNPLKPVRSLAASLDEESREVWSSTDGKPKQTPAKRESFTSGTTAGVRNTLDVDTATPRHGSIAGIGVGVTSPNQGRKKKFDPADPTTWTSPHTSPVETKGRSSSDVGRPDVPIIQIDSREESEKAFTPNIPIITTDADESQHTHRKRGGSDSGTGISGKQKEALPTREPASPPSRYDRTTSPTEKHLSPKGKASKTSVSGGVVAEDDASRRFSNQSGSFSTMTTDSGDHYTRFGDQRGDEEVVEESSDEQRSSGDENSQSAERGRTRKKRLDEETAAERDHEDDLKNTNTEEPPSSDTPQIRSTLDPVDIGSRTTSGKFSETKSGVHPTSNYNRAVSPAGLSAFGADDEDIQKAKTLALRISPLDDKIVERHVKMIIRGDWKNFQDHEADDALFRHEPRLYLACSDLSNEASYALEWTIGTLLKDGDTILVISALGDETASKQKDLDEATPEIRMESAKAAEEANQTMEQLTRQTTNQAESQAPPPAKKLDVPHTSTSHSRSRDGRKPSRKEDERMQAVAKLEGEFLKYVRKTSLQVRCMIEVIHCRSPRHLIVNAIDELEPTLVVVGTRGQGTVRNVMMGSFSNYLVTKSSVPVMVARKRLKKARHAKVNSQQIRMTNNLTPFGMTGKRKSLTQARID